MIQLFFYLFLCFPPSVLADGIVVKDIKVTSAGASSAEAREKAIAEAHRSAFGKLIEERYPTSLVSPPPQPFLEDMVENFSIDREKVTAKSYTASFTFQFNEDLVTAWIQNRPSSSPFSSTSFRQDSPKETFFILNVRYQTFEEWRNLKKILKEISETLVLLSLSRNEARVQLTLPFPPSSLAHDFERKGLVFIQKGREGDVFFKKR